MINELPTFTARVSREDNLWVIAVDGPLPPGSIAVTDTPHFAEVPTETRDLVADLADLHEDQFWVRWQYIINGRDVTADLLQYQDAERDYRDTSAKQLDVQAVRDGAREQALEALASAGLSQRAMGEVVELSQQRVNQILRTTRTPGYHASAG